MAESSLSASWKTSLILSEDFPAALNGPFSLIQFQKCSFPWEALWNLPSNYFKRRESKGCKESKLPEATWCFPKVVCFGRGVAGIKIPAGELLSSLSSHLGWVQLKSRHFALTFRCLGSTPICSIKWINMHSITSTSETLSWFHVSPLCAGGYKQTATQMWWNRKRRREAKSKAQISVAAPDNSFLLCWACVSVTMHKCWFMCGGCQCEAIAGPIIFNNNWMRICYNNGEPCQNNLV